VYLRIPAWTSRKKREELKQWCRNWVEKRILPDPGLRKKFENKEIRNGLIIHTFDKCFNLRLSPNHDSKIKIRNIEDALLVTYPGDLNPTELQKTVRKMINRFLSKYYYSYYQRRVHDLNEEYFCKKIAKITLRFMSSKWGSCSHKGRISLSTRLIFAPRDVSDYVIIHELAHLIELNHSKQYWKIVENAMPDYRKHETWLKKNGHLCDYL
jgi:predicted metal-dependent hydrolase